ncbi:MAG: redoxin domain-containing protein [Bacteroidales bacterium]|nr:redoxin domain-containing protein [Bacteroidales bacterium]
MKKLLLVILSLVLNVSLFAQTPLTQAVDFTATDCHGTEVHLFDILDGGQYVLIDFFYMACGPCNQAAPKVVEAYHALGCNEHEVFFMEISNSDNDAALLNWVEQYGVEYPTIGTTSGGNTICNTYGISAYPTVILIAPDRQIVIQDLWPINNAQSIINALAPYGIQQHDCGGGTTQYTISTSSNPSAGGSTSGGGSYDEGASCTVHATANSGYTFTNWTENGAQVSTNANYTFTVTGNRTLVANFTQQPSSYTITTSSNPSNGGTTTGGGTYPSGASCTVTATANPGYVFQKWMQGSTQVSTNPSYTFTVTGNRNLVAYFVQETYTVEVESADPTMGTVSGGGNFTAGQTCGVAAHANDGYAFANWTDNGTVVSTNAFYTFTVTGSCTLVAHFAAASVEITATVDPAQGGTVTGAGTYNAGETVTLEVIPAESYNFINWTENGQVVSEEMTYTFVAEASRNLVAHLEMDDAVSEHLNGLKMYPNPAQDKLSIECGSNISSLKVYNMVGAEVYSSEDCGTQTVISLDAMPNGIYFIKLTSEGVAETLRFVKE